MATNRFLTLIKARIDLALFAVCVAFFLIAPYTDMEVASWFYDGEFYWNNNAIIRAIYLIFAKIHIAYILVLISLAVFFYRKKLKLKMFQKLYLLAALIIGPGILVNSVLKDNSVGRPRPVHIVEFGGNENYSRPFHYSGACERNCSFVSGHAAIGFYPLTLFWLSRRRRWLAIGLGMGAIVGGTRILQGGHFLSDVIFAGWTVYFTAQACNALFQKYIYSLKST